MTPRPPDSWTWRKRCVPSQLSLMATVSPSVCPTVFFSVPKGCSSAPFFPYSTVHSLAACVPPSFIFSAVRRGFFPFFTTPSFPFPQFTRSLFPARGPFLFSVSFARALFSPQSQPELRCEIPLWISPPPPACLYKIIFSTNTGPLPCFSHRCLAR